MKDPDDMEMKPEDEVSSESSDEYQSWDYTEPDNLFRPRFDFVGKAKSRFARILREQPKVRKLQKHPTVEDQMKINDVIIINKAILKTAEHEQFKIDLQQKDIFKFIEDTLEHRNKTDQRIALLEKQVQEIIQTNADMKATYLPEQFQEYRKGMIE